MSDHQSYTRRDTQEAFDVARRLAGKAIDEIERLRGHPGLEGPASGVRVSIETACTAFEADDPTAAGTALAEALRYLVAAREAAGTAAPAPANGKRGLAFDLLDQAASAIERVTHRVRNAQSNHTTFGAIRTPHSERMP